MKVIDHIKNSTDTRFSFEILPPLKGMSIQSIYDGIDPLMEFKPPFINVTYHREEHVYKERNDGLLQKVSVRKRPGTVGICAAIMNKYHVDAVPHIICGGFNKEETENALIDLQFLGIENILALRGDPIKNETHFIANKAGHKYAVNLIDQVVEMNSGNFLHEETGNSAATNFCIGAAGYPEKHFESMNLKTDLKHLKEKVDAGAEFIVTQMFFDNQKYFDFVKSCRETGINVPIIPGLKPITTLKHISFLPKFFHIDFPEELSNELEKCTSNAEAKEVGIEWGIKQSKELVDYGVPLLHYYTMGKGASVKKIASEIF
ncbi:MAG: methylenetetrahydrofolate reductase [NAD(P)H] [Crocinitomicaceae bacterium]|jgi:methylenetetrahydrofolate reductase (NADPH)|nr:methylenetetrahydrofolate reductase [NAD(P)H] [Crocinitomicaceae bacterium]MBT6029739.1 methylenetetrahydrofolate reductase [NAD(P)H] [Crocinitomicaceae bacterium]MBT6515541.1 methylenetetrahydrofolate reductase [NAD(P)H] [Crocinitomicaceae bacterium]MDG2330152.1 methylenetetrahydrofolate reductase [NAD(P)H] [Flavobacteriales bacterium]